MNAFIARVLELERSRDSSTVDFVVDVVDSQQQNMTAVTVAVVDLE